MPISVCGWCYIKKGDLVTFVETEQCYLLLPAEIVVGQALREIGKALRAKGVTHAQLMKRGRQLRGELLKEKYGLTDPGT